MFPFAPKHLKQARLYIAEAGKLLSYQRDLLSDSAQLGIQSAIDALRTAVRGKERTEIEARMRDLETACLPLQPPAADAGWKENVEVILVAITIALGVRTYFVQPFTIPTGSMQPTLNGIISKASDTPPPTPFVRILKWAVMGRDYFNIVAKRSETITAVEERFLFNLRLGLFSYTVVQTDAGSYWTRVPRAALAADQRCRIGHRFEPGDIIARGTYTSGDHVLVDKFSYHFFPPQRGNVFVFNTQNIPTRENLLNPGGPSQFYIKRLAAFAGDQLRIDPPTLYRNGAPAPEAPFQRVMAGTLRRPSESGYRGYSNGPEHTSFPLLGSPTATYTVPETAYFALGDNSYHSSDSRDWGGVPQQNVIGRGVFVYWPISRHWGPIR